MIHDFDLFQECCSKVLVQYAKISVGYGTDRIFFEENSTFEIESGDVGGYPHYTSEDGLWAIAVCSRQWHIQKHERRYGLRAMREGNRNLGHFVNTFKPGRLIS